MSAAVVPGDGRTETLLPAALIVFAGYTGFGMTGFGASPITVAVLAHFLPLLWAGHQLHMRVAPGALTPRIAG